LKRSQEGNFATRLVELIQAGNFVRVMEMFPPGLPSPHLMNESQKFDLAFRFDKLAESIERLESRADAFSLPELKDGDRIHLNSIGIAAELKRRTGNDIVPTITLRDANRQNLLGSVAYAIYAAIENILIVRGDPYSETNDNPKNVYDVKKISTIVSAIRHLEDHLTNQFSLCIITPINLTKSNDEKYLRTIKEREKNGVDIFLAEQMFESIDSYIKRIEAVRKAGIHSPIIHNIFPLKNQEDAVK
jgi:5,10-methylenetetrahydrofolate reductase